MGASNSHLGSRRPYHRGGGGDGGGSRGNRNMKRRISSFFICGASSSSRSSSHAPIHEIDDYPAELLACSAGHNSIVTEELQNSTKEELTIFCSEIERSHSTIDESSLSSNAIIEASTGSRSVETSNDGKQLCEHKDLVSDVSNDHNIPTEPYSRRTGDTGSSSSSAEQQSSQTVSIGSNVVEVDYPKTGGGSQNLPAEVCSSSTPHQERENSCAGRVLPTEFPANDIHDSDSSSIPVFSDSSLLASQPLRDETAQEAVPMGPGFLTLDSEGDRRSGSVLHVDVVSISSSSLFSGTREVSNREARRNSRRLFWDAFSRRSSRRHSDSRTIFFSSEDTDDLGSQDRWLLDFSGDLFEDGVGSDSGYLGSRNHGMYEGRWHSRSEIWDRFRGGLDESNRQTMFCASGLHPDGTCSCESFLTAESATRGSISRIVMLAEALFEVLDEIHRQPVSLSLSVVSAPAPESVVNSFPLKSHKKPNAAESGDDAEQCYICLAEYEEGEKIRVLPCGHEYHMACVDKWLKEIHGVCPLCRGDVCVGVTEESVSNSG